GRHRRDPIKALRGDRRMEIVDLVCRDRRPLEHSQSSVREDRLMSLSRRPIFPCHVAVVSGGSAPSKAVPLIVRAHPMEAVATCQLSFEVINVGEFDIWHGALVVVAILVDPRNRIRTRTAV